MSGFVIQRDGFGGDWFVTRMYTRGENGWVLGDQYTWDVDRAKAHVFPTRQAAESWINGRPNKGTIQVAS